MTFWLLPARERTDMFDKLLVTKLKGLITPQVNFIQKSEKVVEAARKKQKGQWRWWRINNFKSCM
jgi:uncharacterized protein YbcI